MASVKCGFCGKKKASVDAAIDAGWYPNYWYNVGGTEKPGDCAVCPKCAARHCHDPSDTGELLVRSRHERFLKHDPVYENMSIAGSSHNVRRLRNQLRGLRGRR